MRPKALNKKFWLSLIIFGLVGQVAWVVENMYLNVFIYKMFQATPGQISLMVGSSAVVATLTTILIGPLSDKIGKRKIFITLGYLFWGLSILAFALLRVEWISRWFPAAISAAGVGIALTILLDCVMTFFGSTANDAAFNAWLTDATPHPIRGKVEGVNAMMPLLAILVVFGGFMFFDLSLPQSWSMIFVIIGAVVFVLGMLGFWLIEDVKIETRENQSYFKNIFYGFKPSIMKKLPQLYYALIAFALFGISINVFMPYLILYYSETLALPNYVMIMAPAIIIAALVTALYGKRYDQKGFKAAVIPPLVFLAIGYIVLFLFTQTPLVFIGSLFMMCGYLMGMAVFGAVIRDHIPQNRSGMFQGLRIVAQVLIPGIIGPAIGARVLQKARQIINDDGTTAFLPNQNIFMSFFIVLLLVIPFVIMVSKKIKPTFESLTTPYEKDLDINAPWQDYPRPQLKRKSYLNLNGPWDFAYVKRGHCPKTFETIIVPFAPQSKLSGIEEGHGKKIDLYYRKTFTLPKGFQKGQVLLHFGAVDQIARVIVNGQALTRHEGGYLPFTVNITPALQPVNSLEAVNTFETVITLEVIVEDDLNHDYPWGKQTNNRGGMWYTPVSGIWQSVWVESVPNNYIEGLRFDTTLDTVTLTVTGGKGEKTLTIEGPKGPITQSFTANSITLPISDPRPWSPEDPYLYHCTLATGEDVVESYFALRTLSTKEIGGIPRLCLNGEPYFFNGLLDQGYFSDGIYLPATLQGFKDDIITAKALGFNTLRKHIKIEPALFYYLCDSLGMVVFQDLVNNGHYHYLRDTVLPNLGVIKMSDRLIGRSKRQKEVFISQMKETMDTLHPFASICYWTLFNEGWGQFEADKIYDMAKKMDPSRFMDATSGWFWQKNSDVNSYHVYFKPVKLSKGRRPLVLSEFGGYSYNAPGHVFNTKRVHGYKKLDSPQSFAKELAALYQREILPLIPTGLCASIYTQLSDVEDETNGLITYDRQLVKAGANTLAPLYQKMKEAIYSPKG